MSLILVRKQEKIKELGLLSAEDKKGFYLHPTLAVTPERVSLGLVSTSFILRESIGRKSKERDKLPIEEKESNVWLSSYKNAIKIAESSPGTALTLVGDRESDIYELFSEHHNCCLDNRPEILIRAQYDRIIEPKKHKGAKPHKFSDALKKAKLLGKVEFSINSRTSKRRIVEQDISFCKVTIKRPPETKKELSCVTLYLLQAKESSPPDEGSAINWTLISTKPIKTLDDAKKL